MANYRSIHTKMWSDPDIEKMPAMARFVFLYLITCPQRNESALYETTMNRIARDTGLTAKQTLAAMEALGKMEKVMYDDRTSTVWVVNAVKHQAINENCAKSILTDLDRCSSEELCAAFAQKYNGFKGLQTHPERFGGTTDGLANPSYRVQGTGDRVQGTGKGEESEKGDDKKPFGEFVRLTDAERIKLVEKLRSPQRADRAIEILDNYLGESTKNQRKYTSHYRAILTWCIGELEDRERKERKGGGPVPADPGPRMKRCDKCQKEYPSKLILCPKCYPDNPTKPPPEVASILSSLGSHMKM
jgi:hypothetical protein